jgi:hypothetical protein
MSLAEIGALRIARQLRIPAIDGLVGKVHAGCLARKDGSLLGVTSAIAAIHRLPTESQPIAGYLSESHRRIIIHNGGAVNIALRPISLSTSFRKAGLASLIDQGHAA